MSPLSPLQADTIPLLLPFLLPPAPPLPAHLLTPLFRHRLLYLPPDLSEMDRQLSPFPLPITSEALQRRLESLAGGYTLGPTKYAHDGEHAVARTGIWEEGKGEEEWREGEGVEMHFLHDAEEGWGFHGLRLPGQAEEMGLRWADNTREVEPPSAISTEPTDVEDNGSLDPNTYGEDEQDAKDYWAGFSPPQSPEMGAVGGTEIDEEEREREYWAQYSNGPSKAASPVMSRRESEVAVPKRESKLGKMERTEEGEEEVEGRHRSGTIMASSSTPAEPATSVPTQSSSRSTSPHVSGAPRTLLQSRLRMKTLSLLQREWADFLGPSGAADEREEKGIRWLALGREVSGSGAAVVAAGMGDEGEEKAKRTMRTLKEMYEVFGEEEGGFYRLIEQALGTADEGALGGEGGIPRNYSFDQATYWE
ncbi:uncharacterized protein MKK02DRAFT_42125 [Dioszegia hungarica]|uniref:Uncharacterized protein n=1 Tax=Dioszegia hungarica TaxID=4972 RepID=A0AA38LXA8_9TREE|nr:uncharacterized protein MKK02DRAFT_42125 [Dioszegia hungarica]KAI9637754.1 hypothetical protein MKK02DRAFT_42125 [Dioszegia hungarica]